jgi:hypothetical protein
MKPTVDQRPTTVLAQILETSIRDLEAERSKIETEISRLREAQKVLGDAFEFGVAVKEVTQGTSSYRGAKGVPEEIRQQMVGMRRQGAKLREISEKFGVSVVTARKHTMVARRWVRGVFSHLTAAQKLEIIELAKGGMSKRLICKTTGRAPATVRKVLNKATALRGGQL